MPGHGWRQQTVLKSLRFFASGAVVMKPPGLISLQDIKHIKRNNSKTFSPCGYSDVRSSLKQIRAEIPII